MTFSYPVSYGPRHSHLDCLSIQLIALHSRRAKARRSWRHQVLDRRRALLHWRLFPCSLLPPRFTFWQNGALVCGTVRGHCVHSYGRIGMTRVAEVRRVSRVDDLLVVGINQKAVDERREKGPNENRNNLGWSFARPSIPTGCRGTHE